jgi:phosphoglycolate phosphatase-like HAD superfamily hydrolase
VPRESVLEVGDETRDVEAARGPGLTSAAVTWTWGYATEAAPRAARPNVLVAQVVELARLLGVA